MKRTFFLMMILTLAVTLIAPSSVLAQTAAAQTWTSSIYYYNPDTAGGGLSVTYYTQAGTPVSSPNIQVQGHGSGEIFIGEVGVGAGFRGSAVLNSEVPVMAVYEQTPGGKDPNYARLLYTAFDVSQGSGKVYIPNFVYNVNHFSTQVGIQKIAGDVGTVTLHFVDMNGVETTVVSPTPLETPRSWIFTGEDVGLPSGFDGSLWIDAGDTSIVAAAEELQDNGRKAYAFEGVATPSTTVYMPSMMCRFAPGNQTSVYAIQNASDTPATGVKVQLYNDATKKLLATYTLPTTIQPGAKYLLDVCKIKGTLYKGGSAVISSSQGETLAVVGKVASTTGISTAFTGKAQGSTTTILPYVVWSANPIKGYRTTISVMNVGGAAATNVKAVFYKPDGTQAREFVLATTAKPLPANIKVKFNPSNTSAKVLRSDGSYRGGVEIISDQPVVVTVRLERRISGVRGVTMFGEDYLGVGQ